MLAYLARENNCITQVSFQRRSAPILQKIKEACLKKGAITHALVEFNKYDMNPMSGDRDRMLDDYVHAVDTARWICGGEVVKIESHCRRLMVPDINWIASSLYFANGSSCYVIGSWTSGRRIFRAHMHARGICGEVEVEKEAYLYTEGDYEGVKYDSREIAGSDELYVYGGFRNKSREFINSLLSGKEETSSPFSDALKTMHVCETILAQALMEGV
jgi:predicted dehydrogenase